MKYSLAILVAGLIQLAAASPLIPVDPICARSADSSVVPIDCYPDGPPDVPPTKPVTPRPPIGPTRPLPIVPDPICLEEEHRNLSDCESPICRQFEEGGEWECHMLKKRTIADVEAEAKKAKREIVPIHIPDECYKRIPICVFVVDECTGLASKVYVIMLSRLLLLSLSTLLAFFSWPSLAALFSTVLLTSTFP